MPAARAVEDSGNVSGCTTEVKAVWTGLPERLQLDLRLLMAQQRRERWQSECHIMPQLQDFARALFSRENDAQIVRRLYIALGYLKVPDDWDNPP